MKKTFLCLLLLFSLFSSLMAQETSTASDTADEAVNEQYETFSWSPVAKAKQYGVTIERWDENKNDWVSYKEVKTKEPKLEVLFTPGSYRVSICTYNLIGRKSKPSDWVDFKILEENVPYLNKRFFPVNPDWNIPVLFIDRSENQETSKNNYNDSIYINNSDAMNALYIDEDYELELLLVKGRNIFSPKTEFYLVPKSQSPENAFINWCDTPREISLGIVSRNSKDNSVIVTYEPSTLRSGYYALEVRNPGGYTDSLDILVLDNTAPQITPDKGFEIDEHYSVNSIFTGSSQSCEMSVLGKGLNSTMEFYLEPTTGPYAYPFETVLPRDTVPLEIKDTIKNANSTAQVMLACNTGNLHTGYYNLITKNWDGSTAKFLCLIKKPFDNDYTKNVKKLKSKFNKRTDYVDVTIQDSKFSADKTYTLVSEYDSKIDSNNKVPLYLSSNGKKLTGKLSPSQLTFGKYALMIEDAFASNVIYCTIDNTLKITTTKMSEAVIEKTFFRPVGNNTEVTLDADDVGSIQFFDSKVLMKKRMPPLFSTFRFDLSIMKEDGVVIDAELDLLHFNFVSWSLGYEHQSIGSERYHGMFSMLRFVIPHEIFAPYIGAGVGMNLLPPDAGINSFDDALSMFTNKDELYGIAQVGINLLTILDVRYNLFYNNMLGDSPYFSESISVGTTFPIRSYKFKRKVITQSAQITKAGTMNVTNFLEASAKVDKVTLLQSTSVGGFEEFNNLENVTLDTSVQVIEENAFRNCQNLKSVSFEEKYDLEGLPLTIKSNAFANDYMIDTIYIPYRTKTIEMGAFNNWTEGQNIILCWESDDESERDLSGLDNSLATVHYANGDIYKADFETPLDDERNWVPLNNLEIKNVSVLQNDKYLLGMRLKGVGSKWYLSELDTWINQESPVEITNYIKSGNKLSFKVQGDGNSYNCIITTQDGGYFYYKFKTKKDNVVTVEIPYKKMDKYSYSSQKKLDVDKIKMFCIMPMCKGEWNDISFFDFEVTK